MGIQVTLQTPVVYATPRTVSARVQLLFLLLIGAVATAAAAAAATVVTSTGA